MNTFEEAGLHPRIQKSITEIGFQTPTPIQQKTIPFILNESKDLIGLAQTGTGKTAAFGLPVISMVSTNQQKVQSIILSPTRELCIQIAKDLDNYSRYMDNFKVVPVYGGASIDTQIRALKKNPQIVVGTPGRTLDLIRRKKLNLSAIQWLILDEADEMLSMGFQEDITEILSKTPNRKRTLLFSATMPPEIRSITTKYMKDPVEISAGVKNRGSDFVDHIFFVVNGRNRYEALKRYCDVHPSIYGIVFCRTRMETKEVAEKLFSEGYNVDALHGDLSQNQRDYVMNRFRQKNLQLLVATDVAARGLDINTLTHVINYNLPDDNDIYIHRSGRTGRAGKKGTCLSILNQKDLFKIKRIEKKIGKSINEQNVPTIKEIYKKQLFNFIDKIENTNHSQVDIEEFLPEIEKKLEWISKEDLIKRLISNEFSRFSQYENSKDLNAPEKSRKKKTKRKDKNSSFTSYSINIGSKQHINVPKLMGFLNDHLNERKAKFGKISINQKESLFEIDSAFENHLEKSLKRVSFGSTQIKIKKRNQPSQKVA